MPTIIQKIKQRVERLTSSCWPLSKKKSSSSNKNQDLPSSQVALNISGTNNSENTNNSVGNHNTSTLNPDTLTNNANRTRKYTNGHKEEIYIEETYIFGKTLGSGTFGTVKLAEHTQTHEKVAVKIVDKSKIKGKEVIMKSEIKVLKKVNHPNIIGLVDIYESKNQVFLVCELATGGELFDQIVAKGYYTEKDAANLAKQMLNAVSYLHSMNIVHRDLKPENLLFKDPSPNALLMVTDFGLSRISKDDYGLHTSCGTPAYVAPEIIKKTGHGKPVDMWAIGVITYVLLSGYTPFYGEDQMELFTNIVRGVFEFDVEYWRQVSPAAKEFISSLLIVDPAKRLTAETALQHKWLATEATTDLLPAAKKYFDAKKTFRKAGNMIIGMNRMKNQSQYSRRSNSSINSVEDRV